MANILLGVSGSISAYKAADLTRKLLANGHKVRAILGAGALGFITKDLLYYLGAEEVWGPEDDFKNSVSPIPHITLARWADIFVLAPASANTISSLAQGRAHDLLSTTVLALESSIPQLIFPAMNPVMWSNPIVQRNVRALSHMTIISPSSGVMACGEEGEGKLPLPEEMAQLISAWPKTASLNRERVTITVGATRSYLDPVRYITNPSSGVTGLLIAEALLRSGAQVSVISGPSSLDLFKGLKSHPYLELYQAISSSDFCQKAKEVTGDGDIFIATAAIGDWAPSFSEQKIKKGESDLKLTLLKTPDTLKTILSEKKLKLSIGFAAESELSHEHLQKKYEKKPVGLLVGTQIGLKQNGEAIGFTQGSAHYKFYNHQGPLFEGELTKNKLAEKLVDFIVSEINQ